MRPRALWLEGNEYRRRDVERDAREDAMRVALFAEAEQQAAGVVVNHDKGDEG